MESLKYVKAIMHIRLVLSSNFYAKNKLFRPCWFSIIRRVEAAALENRALCRPHAAHEYTAVRAYRAGGCLILRDYAAVVAFEVITGH